MIIIFLLLTLLYTGSETNFTSVIKTVIYGGIAVTGAVYFRDKFLEKKYAETENDMDLDAVRESPKRAEITLMKATTDDNVAIEEF